MADWSGVVESTIKNFIREVEVDVKRNRKWLAKLEADGRITYNWSGLSMEWRIQYKRARPKGYADMDTVTFPRRSRHKIATLDWRAYTHDESISKFDKLKNRGPQAIVKMLESTVTDMTEEMEEHFGEELYVDGNASGNGRRIHGIESFMGSSGVGSSYFATNSDSYAGLDTTLGAYGGSVLEGAWPTGTFSSEYDFYTPLLVDYTDAAWAASTKTWPNTCEEALAYGIINSMKNTSKRGRINMVLLNVELYRQFREKLRGKEQINVTQGGGGRGDSLTGLGFGDVVNFEGAEVSYEYGVPASTGYGFNTQQMELRSMQSQLFDFNTNGEYESTDKSLRFSIDFFGNMVFRPRYFFKLKNYT